MSLEDEAKKIYGKKEKFFSKKLMEEIIKNLKDIEVIAEVTLKKLRS